MMCNLKALGLALLAVFAMSAVAASAASAEGVITGPAETVKMTATDITPSVFKYNATSQVRCHKHYEIGNIGETPHGWIDLPGATLTVKVTSSNCETFLNGKKVGIATVTMGTCDEVRHFGTPSIGEIYHGSIDLECQSGSVTIDVYATGNPSHTGTPVCTFTLGQQTGLTGGTASSSGGDITFGGTTTGISASRTGIVCGGAGSTKAAELELNATATATNAAEEPTSVSLSG
jgi:hypothetical protein